MRALYQSIVDDVNRHLAQFERIKKFVLVPEEFSVATGELTPTLKMKRRVVVEKYQDVIEAIYVVVVVARFDRVPRSRVLVRAGEPGPERRNRRTI